MCKICGSLTKNITINKVIYEFCETCGFLCKLNDFILSPNDEYKRYLQHDNFENDNYIKYQEDCFDMIKCFLGKSVLDYGCGNNHILFQWTAQVRTGMGLRMVAH